MTFDWQNLIVLAIVATAAMYVARLAWTSVMARKTSACGGCRNCGTNAPGPQTVTSIGSLNPPPGDCKHPG